MWREGRAAAASSVLTCGTASARRERKSIELFCGCARLLPADVAIGIQAQSPALDAGDLAILRAIRDAMPNANELAPQAVLDYTLKAIRAYDASPVIETASKIETEGQNSQTAD